MAENELELIRNMPSGSYVWGAIPWGWICLNENGNSYVA